MLNVSTWFHKRPSRRRNVRFQLPKVEACEILTLISPLGLPAVPPTELPMPPQEERAIFDFAAAKAEAERLAAETEQFLEELKSGEKEETAWVEDEAPVDEEAPIRVSSAEEIDTDEEEEEEEEPGNPLSGGGVSESEEETEEDEPEVLPANDDSGNPALSVPFIAAQALDDGAALATLEEEAVPPFTPFAGAFPPIGVDGLANPPPQFGVTNNPQLTEADVAALLNKASAATASNDAIIAIVDRNGRILGVRVEDGVGLTGDTLRFAIDGAVAKARTAAFFSNNQAPLPSRTVRFISQTTITEREVESNPNIDDTNSTERGPGFVAPIGLGGHFPPGVPHTPVVDLFNIEHTNRDKLAAVGPDLILGTADDVPLTQRFNADDAFVNAGLTLTTPQAYGVQSGLGVEDVGRGIATLPGGIPLYKALTSPGGPELVGGIGVFFPGSDGYATHEQGFVPGIGQTAEQRINAPRVLEAEYIAYVTANPPIGRIDLVGITLESYGPLAGVDGLRYLIGYGQSLGAGVSNGTNQIVTDGSIANSSGNTILAGMPVADGWLIQPHDGIDLTAADVVQIVQQGIAEANMVRAAIRLPIGTRTKMVFAVTDVSGEILGLFRMPDATVFSIDVAVAKGRNASYYAEAGLNPLDAVPGVPEGTAFTGRTFRFLSEPRFPSGVDGTQPPPFSILNDPGINPATAENNGAPPLASQFQTVSGFDAFNPGRNFRDANDPLNWNGIVFFPGSTPIYKDGKMVGGFGVSGDGVDQDDVVTFSGAQGFLPYDFVLRADEVMVNGVRLPYQKFLRNPRG